VVFVGRATSVQFDSGRSLTVRVISVEPVSPHDEWAWLTGYVMDQRGVATERREIYVRLGGLRLLSPGSGAVRRNRRGEVHVSVAQ
jgi:hypothetical protein